MDAAESRSETTAFAKTTIEDEAALPARTAPLRMSTRHVRGCRSVISPHTTHAQVPGAPSVGVDPGGAGCCVCAAPGSDLSCGQTNQTLVSVCVYVGYVGSPRGVAPRSGGHLTSAWYATRIPRYAPPDYPTYRLLGCKETT